MSRSSVQAQEVGWSNVGHFNAGLASYFKGDAPAAANTIAILPRARGSANTLPTVAKYSDTALSLAQFKEQYFEADDRDRKAAALRKSESATEGALASLAAAASEGADTFSYRLERPILRFARMPKLEAFEAYDVFKPTYIVSQETDMPTWFTTDKVIAGLLGLIATLISIVYLSVRSDIDELKKSNLETPKQISELKVSLISAIKDVEKQAAISNSRLDLILEEMKRPSRR